MQFFIKIVSQFIDFYGLKNIFQAGFFFKSICIIPLELVRKKISIYSVY